MSLDQPIDVDTLKEEESISCILSEKETLQAYHCMNYQENVCSNEEDNEMLNQESMCQFDNNTVQNDKFSKQGTFNCQSSGANNKPKTHFHNVCISISSSSDEDEILPPVPKFTSYAKEYATEGDSRRAPAVKSRCEPSLLHVELPDLDCFPSVNQQDNDLDKFEEIQHLQPTKNDKTEKILKSTVKDIKNNAKSKKLALKCIHVDIDRSVMGLPDAETLWASLQSMTISYSLTDNAVNFSILWLRESVDCEISEDGKITEVAEKCPEDQVLIIFPAANFIDMVQDFKWHLNDGNDTNVLLECANHHKTQFPGKNVTYAIIGVDKYFREKRIKENQKYRSMACGKTNEYSIGDSLLVSFDDVEEATVCLQIHEDIICYMVDTTKDLAALVISFSKGIAEAPYKKESRQNAFTWYAEADTCRGIKVSRSNEGLLQLWVQQIQQFPLASKEVADAIVSNYPSPQLLMQAYRTCSTTQEAGRLLKDVVIRRGVGPLITTRHIGPELSRKVFHFFTEEDGTTLI